jgi:perosamine synthetase
MTTKTILFGKPIIGEEEKQAVLNVMNGSILVHGPKAKKFEEDFAAFTKAPYATSLSSCTAGLHLSYFHYGLGSGDEVLVPAQTHTATAHAVEYVGAKPVFVDAEIETGNMDLDQVEGSITERARAISLVHYLGMPVNMDRVMEIANKHNLLVIEDCALAIGSYFKGVHVGLHGDTGSYSFYPVKQMTTAEGGMLISKHEDVVKNITRKKAFGVDRQVGERKMPSMYDVNMLGFNYRMNEIQAAIGVEQLKRMPRFIEKRTENFKHLTQRLSEISEIEQFKSTHGDYQSSYYCLSIVLSDKLVSHKSEIVKALEAAGIGTSVYYPKPVPHFSYYREKYGYDEKSFPVAKRISRNTIALPVGPHLDGEDMDAIANNLKNIIQGAPS